MHLGIDLSLRSTGLVFIDNHDNVKYKLVTSDSKKLNDEELLMYNIDEILDFIEWNKPTHIGLEGLSFNSVSSSKDIIAGSFWYLRVMLKKYYPHIKVDIIPVLTWRSKLFNKEERKILKETVAQVKLLKKELMKLSKEEKKIKVLENEQLILNSDIKYVTWEKLPEPYKSEFENIGFKKGGYDLSDAMHIANYIKNKI